MIKRMTTLALPVALASMPALGSPIYAASEARVFSNGNVNSGTSPAPSFRVGDGGGNISDYMAVFNVAGLDTSQGINFYFQAGSTSDGLGFNSIPDVEVFVDDDFTAATLVGSDYDLARTGGGTQVGQTAYTVSEAALGVLIDVTANVLAAQANDNLLTISIGATAASLDTDPGGDQMFIFRSFQAPPQDNQVDSTRARLEVVPEPGTLVLTALGAATLLGRRRQQA